MAVLIEPSVCGYCDELVDVDYEPPNGATLAWLNGRPAHNECALRSAVGGIGHLLDHERWCITEGDPDAGHSYRESALQVHAWVRDHGIKAAVERGS